MAHFTKEQPAAEMTPSIVDDLDDREAEVNEGERTATKRHMRLLIFRSPEMWSAVVESLARTRDGEPGSVSPGVASAITSPHPQVVEAVSSLMRHHRVDEVRPEVVDALRDWCSGASSRPKCSHPAGIARSAIRYLVAHGEDGVGEQFIPLLDFPNEAVRTWALEAVEQLRYAPAAGLLVELLGRRLDTTASGRLFDVEAKRHIRLLATLNARDAVPMLIRVAREAGGLLTAAVKALVRIEPKIAAPSLVDMLDDPSKGFRRALLNLMRRARHVESLPRIRTMLVDPREWVRLSALWTVVEMKDFESVERMTSMCFEDPIPAVREAAIKALVTLTGRAAVATLDALLADGKAIRRRVVVHQLSTFNPRIDVRESE